MSEGNGKFLRTIFWGLLIGSFGWTTFVGYGVTQTFGAHCKDQKEEITSIRKEIVEADTNIVDKLAAKIDKTQEDINAIRVMLAKLTR